MPDKRYDDGEPVADSAADEPHDDPWQYAGDEADAPTDSDGDDA